MKIAAGAPGWYDACSPDERAATVALAVSRWKWVVVWSGITGAGLVLAVFVLIAGLLPLRWPPSAVPGAVLAVALCSLALDLAVLLVNGIAWQRVRQVFAGTAPDEVVRPFRRLRWLPTSLISLFGTVAMLMVGIYPLARFGEAGFAGMSVADWSTAGVAVLCVLCGLSTMWLKVVLRPIHAGR
ncbi:hypothetical protein [Nocardia jinanensis]|uniref:Uncharacterized protein n=1 Tax=Nocardia jinanensis TaxID=382504 RepID=A0A917VQB9_9NOCA|nr:hypothetical protein [Nocardia jinanensis]GGL03997.1 hypothetical protein GCM10011588_18290 [Nocardia jinanensis]